MSITSPSSLSALSLGRWNELRPRDKALKLLGEVMDIYAGAPAAP